MGGSGDADHTEEYNGTSWSAGENMIGATRIGSAAAGSQQNAIIWGGQTGDIKWTESLEDRREWGLVVFPSIADKVAKETDSAFTVTPVIAGGGTSVTVNAASETDAAFTVADINPRSYTVGVASETDAAFTVADINPRSYTVGQTSETDAAFAVAILQPVVVAVGQASETDAAFTVTPSQAQYPVRQMLPLLLQTSIPGRTPLVYQVRQTLPKRSHL
jgi:hypothetical protein